MSPPPRHRTVWILRHAKALTDPPRGGSDHERELAPRGRRDAHALGRRLGPKGDRFGLAVRDLPQVVLCSTAARTKQTADRALAGIRERVDVEAMRVLYRADPDDVLAQLQMLDDDVRSVMVVGHNPTAAEVSYELMSPKPAARTIDRDGMPTCAVAVAKLPAARWRDAAFGTAEWARLFAPPY